MSVDKFGRYSHQGMKAQKGPKGDGFELTPEGDYDIKNKRLQNVHDPTHDYDAVNLKTLHPFIKLNSNKRKFDAGGNGICSVADPTDGSDVITKVYFESNTPKKFKDGYYFDQHRLRDVASPLTDDDVVNRKFVTENCLIIGQYGFNAKDLRISNISKPIRANDAVTKVYFDRRTPLVYDDRWDFGNKRLSGLTEPIDNTDAVNKKVLEDRCIKILEDINIKSLETNVKNSIKADLDTLKKKIDDGFSDFEEALRRFSVLLFRHVHNAINGDNTARHSEDTYLDWNEVFAKRNLRAELEVLATSLQ